MSFHIPHDSCASVVNEERGWLYKAPSSYFVMCRFILPCNIPIYFGDYLSCVCVSLSHMHTHNSSLLLHRITLDSLHNYYNHPFFLAHTYPQVNTITSLWHVSLLYFSLLLFRFAWILLLLGNNLIKHNVHKYISHQLWHQQSRWKPWGWVMIRENQTWWIQPGACDINMGLPRENNRLSLTSLRFCQHFVISAPRCRLTWKQTNV